MNLLGVLSEYAKLRQRFSLVNSCRLPFIRTNETLQFVDPFLVEEKSWAALL
jgi:hypothetical protein